MIFNFSWYPYVLLVSSLFLLITIGVYTYFHQLLNEYTRIMRHFAIAMYAAFTLLAILQLVSMDTLGDELCKASGMRQYRNLK